MITLDNQPLSIVENTSFRNLMRKVKPKYDMPGRKHFTEKIVPEKIIPIIPFTKRLNRKYEMEL
nr:unnamed protein product [Callosobruchus analis]